MVYMAVVKVNIKKPIYGNYCYIRASIVDKAIKDGAMLEITIPRGKAIVDPVKWKENGKIMKKVFKFPDNPLVLYGGSVPMENTPKGEVTTPKEEKEREKQASLF